MIWRFLVSLIVALSINIDSYAISDSTKVELESVLEEVVNSNQLIGSHFVAIVDKDGLDSFHAYSKSGPQITKNTPFLIASHTKAFTGTLMAILHESGRLDLDKPISSYELQFGIKGKVDIDHVSIRDLLTHTSGFTSVQHTFKTAFLGYSDQAELVRSLSENLLVAPDYNFRYSNTGPILAAMIAEDATGSTWGELMGKYIVEPLDLKATTSKISDVKKILPSIISSKGGDVFSSGHFKSNLTMHPSGGLISTVNDLAVWLQVNISKDKSNLSKGDIFSGLHYKQVDQSKTYFTYERSGYSLGWDMAEYNGETLLTRFGNYAGYSIHVSFMPDRELGVIAFTNQDVAYLLPHVIANYAYNTILNKGNKRVLFDHDKGRLEKSVQAELSNAPDTIQSVTLDNFPDKYLGTYVSSMNWPKQSLYIEHGKVMVRWGSLEGPLLKVGKKYKAHLGAIQRDLTFHLQEDGSVRSGNGSIELIKI